LEQANFPLADQIWLPSKLDIKRQASICKKKISPIPVPNAIDLSAYSYHNTNTEPSIVLTASYGYPPNLEAATILRDVILPEVQLSIPGVELRLVGSDPYGHAKTLERSPDVHSTGRVADTKPYLRRAGVCAVPIMRGGGTRYKILEALALGCPVVSTPIGSEGLDVEDGVHLLIRPIDRFADAIIWVLQNPLKARELGLNGRRLVQRIYSWDAVEVIMRQSLASILI
jgi:glycosyltransferase involved in cell wall biosynthesis